MSYKTHAETKLPCGCIEVRYLFGRIILRRRFCRHSHGELGPKVWSRSSSGETP